MSADNGIYIAKIDGKYRVTEAGAIENLDYFPVGSEERKEEVRAYFGDAPAFDTKDEAWLYASRLAENCYILEYGVSYIGEWEW